jgi:hypothetical protein
MARGEAPRLGRKLDRDAPARSGIYQLQESARRQGRGSPWPKGRAGSRCEAACVSPQRDCRESGDYAVDRAGGVRAVSQNRSSAVMQQRSEPHDSLDDFPTPPWATRALCEFLRDGRFHSLPNC